MGLSYQDAVGGTLKASDLKPDSRIHLKMDFDSYAQYREWANSRLNNLKREHNRNKLKADFTDDEPRYNSGYVKEHKDWLGTDSLKELKSDIREYLKPELIREVAAKLDDGIRNLDVFNRLKDKKLNFNDYGRGIFSFALASRGLLPVMEYYDEKTGRVIPDKRVRERKVAGGKEFYDIETGNMLEHRRKMRTQEGELLRDKKNMLEASLKSPKMTDEERSKVQARIGEIEKEMRKLTTYTSTIKKSYIDIPKTKAANTIDFYLSPSVSGSLTADQMAMKAVACIILSEKLEKMGFNIRINAVYGVWDKQNASGNFYGLVVPIKQYDEPVDTNLLAVTVSDPRVFRYQGFKDIIVATDEFDADLPYGYGYPSMSDAMDEKIRAEIIRKSIQEAKTSDTNAETNKSNYAKYYFGQNVKTVDDAVKDYENLLSQIEKTYSELADKPETTNA